MPNTTISVIIPSFKRPADLRRCLEAVALQSRPADEVLVVGRLGDADTWSVISLLQHALPVLRIVPVTEPGLIAAMNCGLDHAAGDLLVFTDDDAGPLVDWLARIEAAFADPSIGAVGGRDWLQFPDVPRLFDPAPVSSVGILTWYGFLRGDHHCPLRGHVKKVMFLKGVNMALRSCALGSYRIDTALHGSGAQVGTELDLCLYLRQEGFGVIFDDRIIVKHYGAPRQPGDDRNDLDGVLFRDISFNNHYLIAKHFGLASALAYLCNERVLGSHSMPGLLACLKWCLKGDSDACRRLVTSYRYGLAGFRAGRRAQALARRHCERIASSALDFGDGEANRTGS